MTDEQILAVLEDVMRKQGQEVKRLPPGWLNFARTLLATPAPLSDEPVAVECRKCFRCGHDAHLGQCVNVAPTPSDKQEAVAYVNGDELDNMLDDRVATIQGKPDGWRKTPLYAAPPATPSDKQEAQPSVACTHCWDTDCLTCGTDAAPLAQSAEQDRIDAERYRWLKENAEVIFKESRGFISGASGRLIFSAMPSVYELDSAIDGIIAEEKQEAAAIAKGASK